MAHNDILQIYDFARRELQQTASDISRLERAQQTARNRITRVFEEVEREVDSLNSKFRVHGLELGEINVVPSSPLNGLLVRCRLYVPGNLGTYFNKEAHWWIATPVYHAVDVSPISQELRKYIDSSNIVHGIDLRVADKFIMLRSQVASPSAS